MGEEFECGDVGIIKLVVLELRNVVLVDGIQKLVFESGISVLVFAEDANLLFVISVGLCDDRSSGSGRMDRVGGGYGCNGERESSVSHRLVLRVSDCEDHTSKITVYAV